MATYKHSDVQATGNRGTYVSNPYGGIGMGYQMPNGDIVKSDGNGWYSTIDCRSFAADDGDGYMSAVQRIAPSYR